MTWVTVVVLYLILKKYFFEKVRNFMLARELAVKDSFDNAEHVNRLADEKLLDYQKQIANIESEGRDLIKEAKLKADKQAQAIVDEANSKANNLLMQVNIEIEREKSKAVSEMKTHIAEIAMLVAEKVMERELDQEKHKEYIDQIIDQAGDVKWQS